MTRQGCMDHILRSTDLIQPFHFLHKEYEAKKSPVISQISPPQYIYVQPFRTRTQGGGSQFPIHCSFCHITLNLI